MTTRSTLYTLKIAAKRLAHINRLSHTRALDLVAEGLGHAHWVDLVAAWKEGWRPTPAQTATFEAIERSIDFEEPLSAADKAAMHLNERFGAIDGHTYELRSDIMGVLMGETYYWAVFVDAAPSIEPQWEIYDRSEANPILDPAFKEKVLKIANAEVEKVRLHIAADWGPRSTTPDRNGVVKHPLWKGVESDRWFCLHCDGEFSGERMVSNVWHCPKCSATPIDIHAAPFWRGNAA
jgi:ribosomal protein L37AE/L43A